MAWTEITLPEYDTRPLRFASDTIGEELRFSDPVMLIRPIACGNALERFRD